LCRGLFRSASARNMDEGDYMTALFVYPWGLLLLVALPGWYWLSRFADGRRAQALRHFPRTASSQASRWRYLIPAALLLLAVAVAQPAGNAARDQARRAPDVVFL